MRLLIVQRIFSHYRKAIFDKLDGLYDLKLVHAQNKSGIQQASAGYSKHVKSWQFGKNETNQFLWLFTELIKFKPKVIIHEMAIGMPTMFFTLWIKKILGFRYILWGHGYNRKTGFFPEDKWIDKIRLYVLRKSDAVLLYDKATKKLLSQYMDNEKLFVASNTLDTDQLIHLRKELEKKGREKIREELQWRKQYHLVYIGRLLESKHPEKLIEILNAFPSEFKEKVTFHIIGSGPVEDQLKNKSKELITSDNIVFYGAIHEKEQTGKILYAADLMIIPGAVGLSVNHAFVFDCPVATFSKTINGPYHGPEIEYVIAEKTGILAPAYEIDQMTKQLFHYLTDNEKKQYMRAQVRELLLSTATIDKMIHGFDEAIEFVNTQVH